MDGDEVDFYAQIFKVTLCSATAEESPRSSVVVQKRNAHGSVTLLSGRRRHQFYCCTQYSRAVESQTLVAWLDQLLLVALISPKTPCASFAGEVQPLPGMAGVAEQFASQFVAGGQGPVPGDG